MLFFPFHMWIYVCTFLSFLSLFWKVWLEAHNFFQWTSSWFHWQFILCFCLFVCLCFCTTYFYLSFIISFLQLVLFFWHMLSKITLRGTQVSWVIEHRTLGFSSHHDHRALRPSPTLGCGAVFHGMLAGHSLCPFPLLLPLPQSCYLSFSKIKLINIYFFDHFYFNYFILLLLCFVSHHSVHHYLWM